MYSGVFLYFSNSTIHSSSLIGGKVPVIGRHSVIDKPLSVKRVTPPTITLLGKELFLVHLSKN